MMNITAFLDSDATTPDAAPEPPRFGRRAALTALLFAPCGLVAGAALLFHSRTGMPAQKPGPRRYPPAYWAGDQH